MGDTPKRSKLQQFHAVLRLKKKTDQEPTDGYKKRTIKVDVNLKEFYTVKKKKIDCFECYICSKNFLIEDQVIAHLHQHTDEEMMDWEV